MVWKLDRLGRALCHLVNTVHDQTLHAIQTDQLRAGDVQLFAEEQEFFESTEFPNFGIGGLLRATGRAERLAEASKGQMAPGADGNRDGVEADGLVGLARAHQRAGEVMVDPEVLRVGSLGAPQQLGLSRAPRRWPCVGRP